MNQQLLDQVLRSPRLPSLPTIAIEVIDLVQQKDVNIKQIANTISHDPALTTKILKTVNSSFYGQQQPISTITHALVILGLNAVKTLALGFSLVGNLQNSSAAEFDHLAFWKRSLFTAVAGRSLLKEVGLVQQEEAFLGGLLQDLGELAMSQTLGEAYCRLVAQAGNEHRILLRLEREKFQTTHAEVGAALAEHWKLPPVLVAPIRYHEDPDSCPPELANFIRCVSLGNRVAEVFMNAAPAGPLEQYYQLAQAWLHLPKERSEPLLSTIHKNTVEMRRLFDLPTGSLGNSEEVLARANEALLQINLQQQQMSNELEERNRQLAEEAVTDSLTGIPNRRRLTQFIAGQFVQACNNRQPLSVLFIDTDHFKNVNDTYGHPMGDRVLMELAALLRKTIPPAALVARYGGEEFAIVLPQTTRVVAAALAENLRQMVAAAAIAGEDDQQLHITVSIGVATQENACFDHHEHLLKAADRGVYAAKAAGRNCVRVFAPKPRAVTAA